MQNRKAAITKGRIKVMENKLWTGSPSSLVFDTKATDLILKNGAEVSLSLYEYILLSVC